MNAMITAAEATEEMRTKLTTMEGDQGLLPNASDCKTNQHSGSQNIAMHTHTTHNTTQPQKRGVNKYSTAPPVNNHVGANKRRGSEPTDHHTTVRLNNNKASSHSRCIYNNLDSGRSIGYSTQQIKVHQPSNNIRKERRKIHENLKLMSINVRGIKSKVSAISAALNTHGTHICCISETLLAEGEDIHIDGYKGITKSRKKDGGGVMILIRNDITPHVDIPEEKPVDNHMEIIWIRTKSKPPIHIGAYYGKQENCNMDVITEEYENLTGSISGKINSNNELILLGDFNAKLEIVHNEVVQKQSRNGNLLQALLETTHMRAINISESHVGTWTRINMRNANEKSVIDYTITTDNLNDRIVESETDENNTLNINGKHPTDHRAITMTLQMKRAHKPEIIHIWKKGNPEKWKKYNTEVCEIWKKAKHKGYDTLQNTIISALNLHIGKTSFDTNKKMNTTNDAIRTLRKERKILRKIFKARCLRGTNDDKRKAKEAYLTCQTKLRDEIEREDKTRNDNKLKELIKAGGINSNNFWQIRKRILRQKPDVYDLINEEGKVIENKQEALDYTANYFENLYQAREGDKEQTHWTDKIEHRVNKLEKMYNNRLIPTKAISERELNQAIKQLSRSKSPGPDNIPNEALIEANNEMRMIILYVFNKIYSEEEIPKSWSDGKIIRIYKERARKENAVMKGVSL